MDEQAGEVHLPGGAVLGSAGVAGAATVSKDYEDVPTPRALLESVFERLTPWLDNDGELPRDHHMRYVVSSRAQVDRVLDHFMAKAEKCLLPTLEK